MLDRFLPENITQGEVTSIRILQYFIVFTIFACTILTFIYWVSPIGDDTPFHLIAAFNIFLFFLLKFTGAKNIVGNLYIAIWAIILTQLSLRTGGIYSMDTLSMSLIPLVGFALLNHWSGFGWFLFYMGYIYYMWSIVDSPAANEIYKLQREVFDKNYYVLGGLVLAFFTFGIFSIFYYQNRKLVAQLLANEAFLKIHLDKLDKQSVLLKQAQDDLKRSNTELEEFAYVTSHDLKQPLRTVNSFASLLKDHLNKKNVLDKETTQMLQFIIAGSKKMNLLITDLLAFAKLKKEVDITFSKVNLAQLFNSVLFDLKDQLDTSGGLITVGLLPELAVIPVKMNQLFQNLISNAIKFRKKENKLEIRVSAEEKETHWEFTVKDNGIGIKKAHQEKIFAPFKKLHNSNEFEGSGIGLATCTHIVKLHNGHIWADSNFGQGTTFHFTIAKDLTKVSQKEKSIPSKDVLPNLLS